MRVIKNVGLIVLGVLLGIVASRAGARIEAQGIQEVQPGQPAGPIITGENIGFQLVTPPTGRGDVATGKWMIRVNGRWLPAMSPVGPVHAK
jgi:hypothetical protein